MKAIIFSPQKSIEKEIEIVTQLFLEGLECFHLRKPHYSYKRLKEYIEKIPKQYHNRIVIHSNYKLCLKYNLRGLHLPAKERDDFFVRLRIKQIKRKSPWISVSTSFHAIAELDQFKDIYNYVFLSPIFDSISKMDYQSGFKEFSLISAIQRTKFKVFALGGVDENKISTVAEMGFYGCAFLGSIWNSPSPVNLFKNVKSQL